MGTLTRKQREIAERGDLILDVARRMLVDKGYLGLTMDRVAEATEYSKGTIYLHFSCKEEILAALAIQSAEKRIELFERAATFQGRARERMSAVGQADGLFVRLFPQHFEIETILTTNSLREKTSEARRTALEACDFRCLSTVTGIVRDAVASGDLELSGPEEGGQLAFGLWSMAFGAHLLEADPNVDMAQKMGLSDAQAALNANFHRFLDGFSWKPLSTEWDYDETARRIRDEVFPDEWRTLAGRS